MLVTSENLLRRQSLFAQDFVSRSEELKEKIEGKSFLVVGGAGSIGSAVVKELVLCRARKIVIVDLSENNLVKLIRSIRSGNLHVKSDLVTYSIDMDSPEFLCMLDEHLDFDYFMNFAALKHVRSERNAITLSRLIRVNILNAVKMARQAQEYGAKRYFCVSTDKAVNPLSMMGASKALMEKFLFCEPLDLVTTMSRFANVAFSDGSLLSGFDDRLRSHEPLAVPSDISRYFVTPRESGQLCILTAMLGEDKDIMCPKISESFRPLSFIEICRRYLKLLGREIESFNSEGAAKDAVKTIDLESRWPCYFFESDTSGEKELEEFIGESEREDQDRFHAISVIAMTDSIDSFDDFYGEYQEIIAKRGFDKSVLLSLFKRFMPNFDHLERNLDLDQKM